MKKEKDTYVYYDVDDFIEDSYFLLWLRNEDEQVNAFWKNWISENPDKQGVIAEAKERVRLLNSFDQTDFEVEGKKEVWGRIASDIGEQKKKRKYRIRILYGAAAILFLLIVGGWFIRKERQDAAEHFLIVQSGNEKKELTLQDGSQVFMDKHTTLKYRADNPRELWLEGQAYFKVKHADRIGVTAPFTVHVGIENIKVLGTSFTVKSIDSAARVVLVHGKVKASVKDRSMIMKPGEKMTWKTDTFLSESVNTQLYLAWKEGEFHFDHTSLKDLTELIKDIYGYELVVKDKTDFQTKTISGTVSATDENVLWETLALMFHAKVQKEGMKIIMTGQ